MADLGSFRAAGFTDSLRRGREEARENLRLGLAERGLQVQESRLDIDRELAGIQADNLELQKQIKVRDFVNKQVDELTSAAEEAQKAGNGEQFMAFLLSQNGQQILGPVEAAIQQAGLQIDVRGKLAAKLLSAADPAQVAANEALKAGATTGATKRAALAPDIVAAETAAAGASAAASREPISEAAARAGAVAAAQEGAKGPGKQIAVRDPASGKAAFIDERQFDPATQVMLPAPPSGFQFQLDEAGSPTGSIEPTPGGPADKVDMTPKERLDVEKTFRGEYTKIAETAREMEVAYQALQQSAGSKTPIGDLAIIIGFAKLADPGSVVREGEVTTIRDTGSLGQKFMNIYKGVVGGGLMSDGQRQELVTQAGNLFKARQDQAKQLRTFYTDASKAAKIDPARVITPGGFAPIVPPPGEENALYIGRKDGKPMFQRPNGTKFVVDPEAE